MRPIWWTSLAIRHGFAPLGASGPLRIIILPEGREGGHLFVHPDGAGLPKHPVNAFIHLSAKIIIGPGFPVLSSAPSTDYYKGPGIIQG